VRFNLAYKHEWIWAALPSIVVVGFFVVSMVISGEWSGLGLGLIVLFGLAWIPVLFWTKRLLYAVVLRDDGLHWRQGRFLQEVIANEAIEAIDDDASKNGVSIAYRLPLGSGKWTSYAVTRGFDVKERALFVEQLRSRVATREKV
jgi:hypothetical protein